jgi:hypothetical protein
MGVMSRHALALLSEVIEPIGGVDYFAEIGVWKGHFCRQMLRTKPNLFRKTYFGIDQWKSLDRRHGHMSKLNEDNWNELYYRSCLDMRYWPKLSILRLSSEEASKIFPDGFFDVVFIDASHFYDDVVNDIKLWMPKVKKGGYLTGHDISSKRHPEVTKAVEYFFGKEYKQILDRAHIWIKQI